MALYSNLSVITSLEPVDLYNNGGALGSATFGNHIDVPTRLGCRGSVSISDCRVFRRGSLFFLSKLATNLNTLLGTYNVINDNGNITIQSTGSYSDLGVVDNIYYLRAGVTISDSLPNYSLDDLSSLSLTDAVKTVWGLGPKQITYIPVNCQLSGPSTANSDDSVTVQVTPNEGHVISLPQQGGSISVYNEDGYIPFTWDANNKTIKFKVP